MQHRFTIDAAHSWSTLVDAWLAGVRELTGRDIAWTPQRRYPLADLNYGPSEAFEQSFLRPDAMLTIRAESWPVGNPRDGWGYQNSMRLVVETRGGLVEMRASNGRHTPELGPHQPWFFGDADHGTLQRVEAVVLATLKASSSP